MGYLLGVREFRYRGYIFAVAYHAEITRGFLLRSQRAHIGIQQDGDASSVDTLWKPHRMTTRTITDLSTVVCALLCAPALLLPRE